MDQQYACAHGHQLTGWDGNGKPVDLTGFFCPICMGQIIGHEDMIDSRILAPVQATVEG